MKSQEINSIHLAKENIGRLLLVFQLSAIISFILNPLLPPSIHTNMLGCIWLSTIYRIRPSNVYGIWITIIYQSIFQHSKNAGNVNMVFFLLVSSYALYKNGKPFFYTTACSKELFYIFGYLLIIWIEKLRGDRIGVALNGLPSIYTKILRRKIVQSM